MSAALQKGAALPCDMQRPAAVMQAMLDEGISTRRGIVCARLEEVYATVTMPFQLRESELAQDQAILFPLFRGMSQRDQARVAIQLTKACRAVECSTVAR